MALLPCGPLSGLALQRLSLSLFIWLLQGGPRDEGIPIPLGVLGCGYRRDVRSSLGYDAFHAIYGSDIVKISVVWVLVGAVAVWYFFIKGK